ncbi:MAG TPA: SgcJ/EcaC family oxidoreductase [Gaiellaceae bacterium]|nr:SgcJ/EcaC family oxidoreductase [Gaiellaceae bacterium]
MDAVERQVEAYNAHDADAFAECYARDVVIENADGTVRVEGREALRTGYEKLFADKPSLHAEIASRIRVGRWVVDEERVIVDRAEDELHAVAIYLLGDDGLIERVRFLP